MTSRGAALGTALLLLTACQPRPSAPPSAPAPQAVAPTPTPSHIEPLGQLTCRADVDGTVLVTDRGIGGTGINTTSPGSLQTADRGIGGTGVSDGSVDVNKARGVTVGERGSGGTGIVGIITGFGSVCLNGLEVGTARTVRLNEDGVATQSATLRLGEVATIDASGGADGFRAVSIAIRHEVSGPVVGLQSADGGLVLDVAGQTVRLDRGGRAPAGLKVGDWVAVSGLRDFVGTIHASRLDRRDSGKTFVSGQPVNRDGQWMLGKLRLQYASGAPPNGTRLALSGSYVADTLRVESVMPETIAPDQAADHRLFVEGYAEAAGTQLHLGQGLQATIGPDFGAPPSSDKLSVVEFIGDGAASLTAVGWHPATMGGAASAAPHRLPVVVAPVAVPQATPIAASNSGDAAASASGGAGGTSATGSASGAATAGGTSDSAGNSGDGRASTSGNSPGGDGPSGGGNGGGKSANVSSSGKTSSGSHTTTAGSGSAGNPGGSPSANNGLGGTGTSGGRSGSSGSSPHGGAPSAN